MSKECHNALAHAIQPRFIAERLDTDCNNSSIKKSVGYQALVWYACRFANRHFLASDMLDDAKMILLDSRFIRARLQNMGLLRGTAVHCCDCDKITSRLSSLQDAMRRKQLQAADENEIDDNGVSSFSPEDYDGQDSVASLVPDIAQWKESYFSTLCSVSTFLREKVGDISNSERHGSAHPESYSGSEYQQRCLKIEVGEVSTIPNLLTSTAYFGS